MLPQTFFRLVFTLLSLGLVIGAGPMHGQTISYFRQFSTPGIAGATAVTAGASGIYVFGSNTAPPGGHATGGIRKYDSRGNEAWTREFTVPHSYVSLSTAAVDETGVYVLLFLGSEPVGNDAGVTLASGDFHSGRHRPRPGRDLE